MKILENDKRVLNALAKNKMCRKELMRELSLARTTISDSLTRLMENGMVEKECEYEKNQRRGRPYAWFNVSEKGLEWIRNGAHN